jgi:hypothetical protein
VNVAVKAGDSVKRGQLLFETVEGALDGLFAVDSHIAAGMDGIVATVDANQGTHVDKGGKLLTLYPRNALQIEMLVSELDLPDIHEGHPVTIEFEWDVDARHGAQGVISRISRIGASAAASGGDGSSGSSGKDARYSVFVDFEPDETVSLDMSVIVHMDGAEVEALEEAEAEVLEEEEEALEEEGH